MTSWQPLQNLAVNLKWNWQRVHGASVCILIGCFWLSCIVKSAYRSMYLPVGSWQPCVWHFICFSFQASFDVVVDYAVCIWDACGCDEYGQGCGCTLVCSCCFLYYRSAAPRCWRRTSDLGQYSNIQCPAKSRNFVLSSLVRRLCFPAPALLSSSWFPYSSSFLIPHPNSPKRRKER